MRRADLLTAVGSVLVTLALIEGVARVTYETPWFATLARTERETSLEPYHHNRYGLRDRDYGPKVPGTKRVLMLGDSFTWGMGVLDDAAVFPQLIEDKLGVEVLNGGIPGAMTDRWVKLWRGVGKDFQPDAVVIVFFLRDGTTVSSKEMFDQIRADFVAEHAATPFYGWSYAYRMVRDRIDRRVLGDYYTRQFHDAYFGDEAATQTWRRTQEDLRTLVREIRAASIPVGLVIFPVLIDLTGDYHFRDICDAVEAFGKGQGVPTFSLLPAFLGQYGPDLWVSDSDQHPNARGHAIAGEALVPFVRGLL